jgi:hypothetical protein
MACQFLYTEDYLNSVASPININPDMDFKGYLLSLCF